MFATDPDRLARFQREAQVLASLNHPGIAAIYGIEEQDDTRALVLELVEGPTLADRISRGPIPVDEALPIAKQIAEALEAAHEAGVIHRDLKPANIKVREDGTVKVLDFGLAKAFQPTTGGDPSESPTLTASATAMGVVLGTAAYMSPEQARGKFVDKRSDIWSFGAVLYEILTGRRLFEGEDVSMTLSSVLQREPDWSHLPSSVSPSLSVFLQRCLTKDPTQRVHDVADVRLALDGAFEITASPADEMVSLQVWQRPVQLAALVTLIAILAGLGGWALRRPEGTVVDVVRYGIALPDAVRLGPYGNLVDVAISPDGTRIIYVGSDPGGTYPNLFLYPIEQLEGAPLPGGGGTIGSFFSPDGESVGFVSYRTPTTLQRLSILGGTPVTVTDASPSSIFGATWGTDDKIVFGTLGHGLFRVSGSGGELEALTTVDIERGEVSHRWPHLMPGNRAVVFMIGSMAAATTTEELAVLDLETGVVTRLSVAGANPHYVSTGHLVYTEADGSVWGTLFDARSLGITGNAVRLVEGVRVKDGGAANFSVSGDGRLIYSTSDFGAVAQRTLVWVDREGREESVLAAPAYFEEFDLSPDETRVAVRISGSSRGIWIYDLERDTTTRLTFDSEVVNGVLPIWTPDGEWVAFGPLLSRKRFDGTGEPEVLDGEGQRFPGAFSPDGTSLVFEDRSSTNIGLWTLDLDASKSSVLLDVEFTERSPALSPDGRWMAYASDETGQREVFVRPFPNVARGKRQISSDGGQWPLWNPAANELFYRGPRGLMAVEFEADEAFTQVAITELFERDIVGGQNRRMAVSQDGQRFLLLSSEAPGLDGEGVQPQITVVLGWDRELLERVPLP